VRVGAGVGDLVAEAFEIFCDGHRTSLRLVLPDGRPARAAVTS
jgi:hypothetical protein